MSLSLRSSGEVGCQALDGVSVAMFLLPSSRLGFPLAKASRIQKPVAPLEVAHTSQPAGAERTGRGARWSSAG